MKSNFNETIENHLNFIGLVAMEDPPRPEAKESIELCSKAGIKIIVFIDIIIKFYKLIILFTVCV